MTENLSLRPMTRTELDTLVDWAAEEGWNPGRTSPATRRLLVEHGDFLYDSDAYDGELPYWLDDGAHSHLVIPYTLITNDIRYVLSPGCANADDFFSLLRDAFDILWAEGEARPGMMSVGLHPRFSGHPARAMAIARFLDHVQHRGDVWICRRREIAEHWRREFPPPCAAAIRPRRPS